MKAFTFFLFFFVVGITGGFLLQSGTDGSQPTSAVAGQEPSDYPAEAEAAGETDPRLDHALRKIDRLQSTIDQLRSGEQALPRSDAVASGTMSMATQPDSEIARLSRALALTPARERSFRAMAEAVWAAGNGTDPLEFEDFDYQLSNQIKSLLSNKQRTFFATLQAESRTDLDEPRAYPKL